MKKISLILALCILVLTISSCSGTRSRFALSVQENESMEVTSFRTKLTKFTKSAYCDVYLYGVDVMVLMDDDDGISLESAVSSDLIDMYEVFGYLEDEMEGEPFYFFDGGSLQYTLDDYNVFVSHAEWDGDDFPDAIYFYPHGITIDEVKNNL